MLHGRTLTTFRKSLLLWFREYRRDLPWRRSQDPYRIWLSEIMLQQTRVAAVIPYFERFLDRFPDVTRLATAPEEDVVRLWSGLGYYRRARNLQKAAQQIVRKYDGAFPRSYGEVVSLPGIGEYTAAAILSIAHGAKHAVLDGNVARVIARLMAIKGGLRENGRWKLLQETAQFLLDSQSPGEWNQAMMELGATLCTPRSPQCLVCPVAQFCRARKLGIAELIPAKYKKAAMVEVTLAAAVVTDTRGRCVLVAPQRTTRKAAHDDVASLVSRMRHFPMLPVRSDAIKELTGLVNAILRHQRIQRSILEPLPEVRHTVTYRRITVLPFRIRVRRLPRGQGLTIVPLGEICSPSSLAVSNLTRKIARAAMGGHDFGSARRAPESGQTLFSGQPLSIA